MSEVRRFYRNQDYERNDLECVANSPQEIRDLIIEMEARLKDAWVADESDEELQKRFRSLIESYGCYTIPRIGAHFLRENAFLLD